jgi:hypothetical protein
VTGEPEDAQVEYLSPEPMPRDFAPARLARRAVVAVASGAGGLSRFGMPAT